MKAISNEKGAPRRLENSLGGLTTTPYPKDNLISVFDLVQRSVRVYKDRPALGTRAFLGTQKADPKKGQRFDPEVFGETNWVSYGKFGERLKAFGAGLKHLGMISQPPFTNFEDVADKKVACSLTIYENTCAEWQTAAHGCFSQSMVTPPRTFVLAHPSCQSACPPAHRDLPLMAPSARCARCADALRCSRARRQRGCKGRGTAGGREALTGGEPWQVVTTVYATLGESAVVDAGRLLFLHSLRTRRMARCAASGAAGAGCVWGSRVHGVGSTFASRGLVVSG